MITICDNALQEITQERLSARRGSSSEISQYDKLLLTINDVRSAPATSAASFDVVPQVDGGMQDLVTRTPEECLSPQEIRGVHAAFTEVLKHILGTESDNNKIRADSDSDVDADADADAVDGSRMPLECGSDEAGGGALAIDLDEAVHGLYTALMYTIQAAHGDADDIYQSFADNAELLSQNPFGWLKDGVAPHGAVDFGLGVGVAGFLLPFAYLAIKAGIEETRAALVEKGKLREAIQFVDDRKEQLETLLQALKERPSLMAMVDAAPLHQILQIADTQVRLEQDHQQRLRFTQKQNAGTLCVGASSMVSGGAIGAQAGLAIVSKSLAFSGSPASSAALGVAGAAGAVLMPVAAAGALGLGIGMTLNSAAAQQRFLQDKQIMEAHWRDLDQWSARAGVGDEQGAIRDFVTQYKMFLTTKSAQRERFWKIFHALNCVFLSGSTIYSGGATLKTAMVSTAGIAALSGSISFPPALIIAATALIAGGGVTMLAGSGQFLSGHGKQHRYGSYRNMDDPQLDRNFLSVLDMMSLLYPDMASLTGATQRALFLQQRERQDDLRQDFLCRTARDLGVRYDGVTTHSTDKDETRTRRKEQKMLLGRSATTRFFTRAGFTVKNKKAQMKAAGTFLKSSLGAVTSASTIKDSYRGATEAVNQDYRAFKVQAAADHAKVQERGRARRLLGTARLGLRHGARMLTMPLQVTGKTASHIFRNPVLEARRLYARKTDHLNLLSMDGWIAKPENNARLCGFLDNVLEQKTSYLAQKIALKSQLYAIDEEHLQHEEQASAIDEWLQAQPEGAPLAAQVKDFLKNLNQDLEQDVKILQQVSLLRLKLQDQQRGTDSGSGMQGDEEREQLIDCFLDSAEELAYLPDQERSGSAAMRLAEYLMDEAPQRYQDHRGMLLEAELQSARMHAMARDALAA